MIGGRFVLALALCLLTTSVSASEFNFEVGTYKKTRVRLKASVEKLKLDSASWIFRSRINGFRDRKHYNGKRDNVLLVPKSTQPDDITLVVWLHGLNGFSEKTFSRVLSQVKSVSKRGHSVAVVIPEMPWSINTRTKRSRQGKVWRHTGDFSQYIGEVKAMLSRWAYHEHSLDLGSVRIAVVGHSAGGSAINSMAIEGSLCSVKPEIIVWSDASYGGWLSSAWQNCLRSTSAEIHVLVRKWDKPHSRASTFMKANPRAAKKIRMQVLDRKRWSHGKIGDNAVDLSSIFQPGC